MASNKKFRFGPIALTNVLTTNLLNPPTANGGVNGGSSPQKILLNVIRVVNKTGAAATFSLWLGGTGGNVAGTELVAAQSVAANSSYEKYFTSGLVIDAADFLVGGASANTTLTIQGEGEIGVA